MGDWKYAQTQPSDELARLEYFSMQKVQDGQKIEFRITVREIIPNGDRTMQFLAQADRQTNQKTAPYTPTGWGSSHLEALSECVKAVHRFPYEGD